VAWFEHGDGGVGEGVAVAVEARDGERPVALTDSVLLTQLDEVAATAEERWLVASLQPLRVPAHGLAPGIGRGMGALEELLVPAMEIRA
jgi:hypothetical protein